MNGGSGNPNGFDVDSNGVITAVGSNVVLWVSAGDIGKYVSSNIPAENIHVYDQGNAQGTPGKTDIFVLHDQSTYTQSDGHKQPMNAVNGNREPTSSDAHDYIFVAGTSNWSSSAGSANVNNSINYYESVNVTINGKTYGGNNRVSEVISGDGKEGLDPSHPDSHTSWEYKLSLDASLDGAAKGDHITSIKLTGLPPGATLSYDGKSYTVDNTGQIIIDVADGSDLKADLTFTSQTQISDLTSIKVDVITNIDNGEGSTHTSGDLSANGDHHDIHLTGGEENHADSETVSLMSIEDDGHHSLDDRVDTQETHDDVQQEALANNADDSDSTAHTLDESTEADKGTAIDHSEDDSSADRTADASLAETADEHTSADQDGAILLVDHDNLDLSSVEQNAPLEQSADESPETSLNMLLGDIDSQLNATDTAQAEETQAATSAQSETDEPNHENVIDLSDIIHDDDAKDLSALIQVTGPSGSEPAAGHVQDVPAESSGSGSGETWNAHDIAELDHLIAPPDTDA
ncbi:TPA: hypothetical protein I9Y46_003408 [Kluyvera ascorbata]|nr:hypothetical protein [Kluyvera ascorbata]